MFGMIGQAAKDVASWPARAKSIEADLVQKVSRHERVSKNVAAEAESRRTFGQHVSDRMAEIAGSWPFIFSFAVFLLVWVALNSVAALSHWDNYPYILLNLLLSMLAAIQAPVIMMSQNRQEARDRLRAEHDYEVNLKAEMEIEQLHQKLDELREKQWEELLAIQREQIDLLNAQMKVLSGPRK